MGPRALHYHPCSTVQLLLLPLHYHPCSTVQLLLLPLHYHPCSTVQLLLSPQGYASGGVTAAKWSLPAVTVNSRRGSSMQNPVPYVYGNKLHIIHPDQSTSSSRTQATARLRM